ncbi:MAG: hypothetical protein CL579_17700 [Alteromonadaceae bacterium]|jgi:hypothetical protein|nr:hypothetical protein [Alteromonadaceae bacterium]MBB19788.1 hypothetical protein [Rickettsiales bacterium]
MVKALANFANVSLKNFGFADRGVLVDMLLINMDGLLICSDEKQQRSKNNYFAFIGKNSNLVCIKNTKNNDLRSMDMNIYGK